MLSAAPRSIRALGEGAHGSVHLCVDPSARRLCVVKWLRSEIDEASEPARRFQREAELMARAAFPGVIQVEDWGRDAQGRTFMVMEFVDGLAPASAVAPGDLDGVERLLRSLAGSLDELHGVGVVHRDIKVDNVLVRDAAAGWEAVILDLGIAKWLGLAAATATGSVFGTPHYMSPEQFRDSKHVGPATDRYALAVIAYELVCGSLPFSGETLPALLQQHLHAPPPPVRFPSRDGSNRLVESPELDAFFAVALAKEPRQRHSSAAELAAVFAAAADAVARRLGLARRGPAPLASERIFAEPATPVVLVHAGPAVPRPLVFDLREGPVVFGRHERCDVRLSSPRLSRHHACLYLHRGRPWVADLASQNGSAWLGRAVPSGAPLAIVAAGDVGELGLYDQRVQLSWWGSTAAAEAAAR